MEKLSYEAVYEDEQYYWFAEIRFNGFYRVEKTTMEAELLFHFPEEKISKGNLFSDVTKVGDWFVFAPFTAKNIVLYHEKSKKIKTFSLKEMISDKSSTVRNDFPRFSSLLAVGNQVYFFPKNYAAIVKLDISSMTLTYEVDWILQVESLLVEDRNPYLRFYFSNSVKVGEKIYAPLLCCSAILLLDCHTGATELMELTEHTNGFNGIFYENGDFWLAPTVGYVVTKWTPETGALVTYPCSERPSSKPSIYNPFIYGNTLYIASGFEEISYELDMSTGLWRESKILNQVLQAERTVFSKKYKNFFFLRLHNNELRFVCGKNLDWYTVNLDTQEIRQQQVFAEEIGADILKKYAVHYKETEYFGLDDFVLLMNSPESVVKEKEKKAQTVGETILRATT